LLKIIEEFRRSLAMAAPDPHHNDIGS